MAPTAIRERRRTLRYRNLLVRQMVQMKINISTLLMEAGVSYNKSKLHKAGYFRELYWPATRTSTKFTLAAHAVSGDGGAAKQNGKYVDPLPAARSLARGTRRAANVYSRDWTRGGLHLTEIVLVKLTSQEVCATRSA